MTASLPAGSNIKIEELPNGCRLIFQNTRRMHLGRWLAIFLFCCWLWGWFVAEASTLKSVMDREAPWLIRGIASLWLVGWTAGGLFVAYFIFRLAHTPGTETLLIEKDSLNWTPAYPWSQVRDRQSLWQYLRLGPKFVKAVRIRRSDVTSVGFEQLDYESSRQSFVLRCEQGSCFPGMMLNETELQWLNVRLNEWKHSAG